jgi:hypothetical protein
VEVNTERRQDIPMSDNEPTPDTSTENDETGVSDEEAEQLEQERQERLDPENRPVNAEVDNTGREFDSEKEDFTYAAGEEPGAEERTTPVIGADRPEGVESDADED